MVYADYSDADDEVCRLVYEHPRELGSGVDAFNRWGEPITPHLTGCNQFELPPPLDIGSCGCSADGLAMSLCDDHSLEFGLPTATPFGSDNESFEVGGLSTEDTPVNGSASFAGTETAFSYSTDVIFATSPPRGRVLVLGSYTLTGVHVVQELLRRGYDVRLPFWDFATPAVMTRLERLLQGQRPTSRLSVVEAGDMFTAIRDCQYAIFHVTAVYPYRSADHARARYVEQVRELFHAAKAAPTLLKRVVVIVPASSFFPIETSSLTEERLCYDCMSVVVSEAEQLAEWAGIQLSVLLPTAVLGASLCGVPADLSGLLRNFALGDSFLTHRAAFDVVSATDVALCCADSLELTDSATTPQPVVLNGGQVALAEVARTVRQHFPHLRPPTLTLPFAISVPYLRLRLRLSRALGRPAKEVSFWHFLYYSVCATRDFGDALKGVTVDGRRLDPAHRIVVETLESMLPPERCAATLRGGSGACIVAIGVVTLLTAVAALRHKMSSA